MKILDNAYLSLNLPQWEILREKKQAIEHLDRLPRNPLARNNEPLAIVIFPLPLDRFLVLVLKPLGYSNQSDDSCLLEIFPFAVYSAETCQNLG